MKTIGHFVIKNLDSFFFFVYFVFCSHNVFVNIGENL